MQKEEWINEVLNSTKGIQKAEAPAFLFEKVAYAIESNKLTETKPIVKWALASFVLVIITVNLFSIIKCSSIQQSVTSESTETNPYNNSIIYTY